MQQLVEKLQQMIKTYYGLRSDLELKPCHSYQTLQKDVYCSIDNSLMVPLCEPKSQHPIAFFKVYDVNKNDTVQHHRLQDLIHLTLQSHINFLDELNVADSLLQYMQVELNPKKVVRLRTAKYLESDPLPSFASHNDFISTNEPIDGQQMLIICKNLHTLDPLALEIHNTVGNHFFIRTDSMGADFMSSVEDLVHLSKTTLYIPRIDQMTPAQQDVLSAYLSLQHNQQNNVLVICGANHTITQMSVKSSVSLDLLKQLHVFNILRDTDNNGDSNELNMNTLHQCAHSILSSHLQNTSCIEIQTKSYHLIPSLTDQFPTVH